MHEGTLLWHGRSLTYDLEVQVQKKAQLDTHRWVQVITSPLQGSNLNLKCFILGLGNWEVGSDSILRTSVFIRFNRTYLRGFLTKYKRKIALYRHQAFLNQFVWSFLPEYVQAPDQHTHKHHTQAWCTHKHARTHTHAHIHSHTNSHTWCISKIFHNIRYTVTKDRANHRS